MSLEELEKEAKNYTKVKAPTGLVDRTAFRFYFGQALCGVIAKDRSGHKSSVLNEAKEYALSAIEVEKSTV